MVAIAYSRVNSATFTCSAGWDERYDPGGQTNGSFALYTRVFQAGDGDPTITPSSNETIIAVVISLRNAAASSFFDVAIAGAAFAAPGSPYDVTIGTFNTVTDGALAIYCWGSLDNNLWVYQSGGGSELVSKDETAGTDAALCVAAESIPAYGATGDQVARQTAKAGDAGRKLWFAIKPVASAAGPTNLKTVDDLAKASVKVVNGLAMASIKTFNGVAYNPLKFKWRKAA
jgi:hypothetical protein